MFNTIIKINYGNMLKNINNDDPYDYMNKLSSLVDRFTPVMKIYDFTMDLKKSEEIEFGIFQYSSQKNSDFNLFKCIYEDKLDDIILNLDKNSRLSNKTLINKIKKGNVNPKLIAYLQPYELNPEKWIISIKKKETEECQKNNVKGSNLHKCNKCGKRNCQVTTAQTRSADEPPTNFVVCLECGNKFKY